MWIIKIGGSLATSPHLARWITAIQAWQDAGIILVPGGGPFAETVRTMQASCQYDNRTGHAMAVLGMEQYALMLAARSAQFHLCQTETEIHHAITQKAIALWQPGYLVSRAGDIPPVWDYTSDSLAGWLARHLNAVSRLDIAGLLLIKSRDPGLDSPATEPIPLADLQASGLIDPFLGLCLQGTNILLRCAGPASLETKDHLALKPDHWHDRGPGRKITFPPVTP